MAIFNGVIIPLIMITMFAFKLIFIVVLTNLKDCFNEFKLIYSLKYLLLLGFILNNKRIGLSSISH